MTVPWHLSRRIALIAFLAAILTTAFCTPPASAVPPALTKVKVIERVYPDLHKREVSRTPTSWNRLRKMARERWYRTHPCAMPTLERTWRLRGHWAAIEKTWDCDGVPESFQSFMRCIPGGEGGYSRMNVRYGGALVDPDNPATFPPRNDVLNPWQIRPGWAAGWESVLAGGSFYYGSDYWTPNRVRIATHPVHAARIAARLGPSNYATKSRCL